MTVVTPPTSVPNAGGRPPDDDLDGLLRDFFNAEMPNPWPAWQTPAPRNEFGSLRRSRASRLSLWRSRLTLVAAAILLLMGGTLFLIGSPVSKDSATPPPPAHGTDAAGRMLDDDVPFMPDQHGASGLHQQGTIPRK
jgi:hypothetical protein